MYPDFTGMENLMYLASLRKIIGKNKVCEAIRRVGLDPDDRRTYGKYSLGMRQRIALAQAIMEKPDVLFLDGYEIIGITQRKLINKGFLSCSYFI